MAATAVPTSVPAPTPTAFDSDPRTLTLSDPA
jgi:hypothetical protein